MGYSDCTFQSWEGWFQRLFGQLHPDPEQEVFHIYFLLFYIFRSQIRNKIKKTLHPTRGYKYLDDVSNRKISKYIPQFLVIYDRVSGVRY
jgi:hypothetical protein